jgi:hypothetical protein
MTDYLGERFPIAGTLGQYPRFKHSPQSHYGNPGDVERRSAAQNM